MPDPQHDKMIDRADYMIKYIENMQQNTKLGDAYCIFCGKLKVIGQEVTRMNAHVVKEDGWRDYIVHKSCYDRDRKISEEGMKQSAEMMEQYFGETMTNILRKFAEDTSQK
jgi:hypothetical protein